ncbi:Transposase IS200 like protein [compost metagenome]
MKKFQNKYRIPSARLQNWDYGSNGAYFITICTKNMEHYFGDVISVETRFIVPNDNNGDEYMKMQLNELGKLAHDLWEEIPNQFPYIELGNFVIMPNHVHGILIINKIKLPSDNSVETRFIASNDIDGNDIDGNDIDDLRRDKSRLYDDGAGPGLIVEKAVETRLIEKEAVETRLIASVPQGGFAEDKNPMLNENISRIIRWYKGRCSFEMRKIHADFSWHSRFHDHIIKDSKSFENIQSYIANNPSKWKEDKFYK